MTNSATMSISILKLLHLKALGPTEFEVQKCDDIPECKILQAWLLT